MAGVEAMPQSKADAPFETIPAIKPFFKSSPVMRESVPSAILMESVEISNFIESHVTKTAPRIYAVSAVRLTFSLSLAIATPLMSEPF